MHLRTYTSGHYEWDPRKARLNALRHGVRFPDAAAVLEDELAVTIVDEDSELEARWVTLGSDAQGRLLAVVWTSRDERIRLISARRASPLERRRYEET